MSPSVLLICPSLLALAAITAAASNCNQQSYGNISGIPKPYDDVQIPFPITTDLIYRDYCDSPTKKQGLLINACTDDKLAPDVLIQDLDQVRIIPSSGSTTVHGIAYCATPTWPVDAARNLPLIRGALPAGGLMHPNAMMPLNLGVPGAMRGALPADHRYRQLYWN